MTRDHKHGTEIKTYVFKHIETERQATTQTAQFQIREIEIGKNSRSRRMKLIGAVVRVNSHIIHLTAVTG